MNYFSLREKSERVNFASNLIEENTFRLPRSSDRCTPSLRTTGRAVSLRVARSLSGSRGLSPSGSRGLSGQRPGRRRRRRRAKMTAVAHEDPLKNPAICIKSQAIIKSYTASIARSIASSSRGSIARMTRPSMIKYIPTTITSIIYNLYRRRTRSETMAAPL